MKKFVHLFCILFIFGLSMKSGNLMNDKQLNMGIFAGSNANLITGVKDMLVSNPAYSGYTMTDRYKFGFTGGLFLNWRPTHFFALQPELVFSMQHGLTQYEDINQLKYDLAFNYDYLNVGLGFKVYPVRNLFIHIIPQVGFNLLPSNLKYTSNGEEIYGADFQTEKILRESIKGRTAVSVGFGLGYQILNRIYVEARYFLGLSDIINTCPNAFHFAETNNKTHNFQLTVGYTLFPIK